MKQNEYNELNNDEKLIYLIQSSKVELIKHCFETLYLSLDDTNPNIVYKNYLVNCDLDISNIVNNVTNYNIGGYNIDLTTTECGVSYAMICMICWVETHSIFDAPITDPNLLNGFDGNDANGHRTFAYGLLYNPITGGYMDEAQQSYTESELKNLYMICIKQHADYAKRRLGNQPYNQYQLDAIVCAAFNYGDVGFWDNKAGSGKPSPMGPMIARNINDPNIPQVWANSCKNGNPTYAKGWTRRRIMEANWFIGNPTSRENY